MAEEYQEIGWVDGYQVFVQYAKEGPDMEEAYALFQEAKNSVLFQNLAEVEEWKENEKKSNLECKEET